MDATKIMQVYEGLKVAVAKAYLCGEKVILAKSELDTGIALAYSSGMVEGKNTNEREGWIAEHFANEKLDLEKLEAVERVAKSELELARIRVEEARALLRLMELTH